MLGGTENGGHPWDGELMTVKVDDPASPLNAVFHGQEFQIADQAFQLQEPVLRDHLHVLISIDVEKTGFSQKSHPAGAPGGQGFSRDLDPRYGKGRVFYSSLGHGAPVYWNARLLEHFLAGIQYALGDLKADSTPSARLHAAKK